MEVRAVSPSSMASSGKAQHAPAQKLQQKAQIPSDRVSQTVAPKGKVSVPIGIIGATLAGTAAPIVAVAGSFKAAAYATGLSKPMLAPFIEAIGIMSYPLLFQTGIPVGAVGGFAGALGARGTDSLLGSMTLGGGSGALASGLYIGLKTKSAPFTALATLGGGIAGMTSGLTEHLLLDRKK